MNICLFFLYATCLICLSFFVVKKKINRNQKVSTVDVAPGIIIRLFLNNLYNIFVVHNVADANPLR